MGNGIGDFFGIVQAACIFHPNGDEFACAFAVAHNRLRQFQRHLFHQRIHLGIARVGDVVDFVLAALAGGNDDEAVVGAGVAVHRNAVERFIGNLFRHLLQHGLGDFGIGGDKAQHGRHVRANHARAFGNAGYLHRVAVAHLPLRAGRFGHGVGRHDGACRQAPIHGAGRGQRGHDFLNRQRFQNHAGGKRQYLFCGAACLFRRRFAHLQCVLFARCAGTRVGIARVHHQRADAVPAEQMPLGHTHGRGAKFVLREHRPHRAFGRQQHQRYIVMLRFFNARLRREKLHTGNEMQLVGRFFDQVYSHQRLLFAFRLNEWNLADKDNVA